MPRGPGKKENYNFDYSRFSGLNGDEDGNAVATMPEGVPPEVMQNLPGELQEAFRLMAISKQTGDVKAQQRSTELVMQAIEKGGPEVKKRFSQEVMQQMAKNPEQKAGLETLLNKQDPANARGGGGNAGSLDGLGSSISQLQKQMKIGAESSASQLQKLKEQQDALEQLRGPEDFARFMAQQGLNEEDLQKAMSGDEAQMQAVFEKAIGSTVSKEATEKAEKMDKALETVDEIHKQLNDLSGPDGVEMAPPMPVAEPAHAPRRPAEPAKPEPKIPVHRVQYSKDESGRLQSVELKCELPGVEAMDAIELDISDKYLRLRTEGPAYVVNVGPFPNLVDAAAARAKFSKKRQELTLTVPAKP
mmetsp:Transcript_102140/g.264132  ORF Transcript_102140/g.264132 Transcript_102140/m.264132 type:complete len:360 (-) Transcript_102140:191-1270(-)